MSILTKPAQQAPPLEIKLRGSDGHPFQQKIRTSKAKRLIIKAGRRSAKTVGLACRGVEKFLGLEWVIGKDGKPQVTMGDKPRRVLYLAPTGEQTDAYWFEVKRALLPGCEAGMFKINETERWIENPGTKQRIKAKTAWNPDTARGDFADELQFDEYQLQNEDVWTEVGEPMLLDNNGDAIFAFTPASLKSDSGSKARDPRHASKMFKKAMTDTTGLWETLHFTSHDNPYISKEGLQIATREMSSDSYRREIMAEDDEIEQSWLVYGQFNEDTQIISPIPLEPFYPRYTFHDFGQANPAALFACQSPEGLIYIYDEYLPGPGKSIYEHVEEWKKRTKGLNVRLRIGGNKTTEDEIRQGYAAFGWPIVEPRLDKKMQILRTQLFMEQNRIFIFNNLSRLRDELANCMWELDEESKPLDKIKDESKWHLMSALRYGLSFFETALPFTNARSRSFLPPGMH